LDAVGIQRRADVGGEKHVAVEAEPEVTGYARGCCRVRGVLGQFDQQPVAVAAEDQILFGIRVLPEPRRRSGPGIQHPPPDPGGVEGVLTQLSHRRR